MSVTSSGRNMPFGRGITPYVQVPTEGRKGQYTLPQQQANRPATTPFTLPGPKPAGSVLAMNPAGKLLPASVPANIQVEAAATPATEPTLKITPQGQQILAIAKEISRDYPVLKDSAASFIRAAIKQSFNKTLNPDTTYLHYFEKAHSSHSSFNGWAHNQPPVSSKTITQAVLANYTARDQHLDTLNGYSAGIYSDGPLASTFDDHNEIKLLPSQLLDLIYKGDFYRTYTAKLTAFWTQHRADYRILAKAQFISQATRQRKNASLNRANYSMLMSAINVGNQGSARSEGRRVSSNRSDGVSVRTFDIHGYEATDILQFQRAGDPRIVLYLPGEDPPFRQFKNTQQLNAWVCRTGAVDKASQHLAQHFSLYNRQDGATLLGRSGVDSALKHLVAGTWSHNLINTSHQRRSSILVGDVFATLAARTEHRDLADANTKITSTLEVNKDIWRERLELINAAVAVTAPFAAPINLLLALGSLAQLAAGVSKAVEGDTTQQRASGVTSAVQALAGFIPGTLKLRNLDAEQTIVRDFAPAQVGELGELGEAEESTQGLISESPDVESQAPPSAEFGSWFGKPAAVDVSNFTPDVQGVYTVISAGGKTLRYVSRRGSTYEVRVRNSQVQLAHEPFARIQLEPQSGEWTAVSEEPVERATDSPIKALMRAIKAMGWGLDESEANRLIALRVFTDVRDAYRAGLKSSNKIYVGVAKQTQVAARRDAAAAKLKLTRVQPIEPAELEPHSGASLPLSIRPDEVLVIQAANCGELSNLAAKLTMEYGAHAELWVIRKADHAFTIVGLPPIGPTVNFSEWNDVWIIDAWANIMCPAKEYIPKLINQMKVWKAKGKILISGRRSFEPTDPAWLAKLTNNPKVVDLKPTFNAPYPWKNYPIEVKKLPAVAVAP